MAVEERKLPQPLQFVLPGLKRECSVQCEKCGFTQVFTVHSDEERSDDWCDLTLDLMLQEEAWTSVGGDDICPSCSDE